MLIKKLLKVVNLKKKIFHILTVLFVALDIRVLARQANVVLQSSCVNQHDNTITTLESSVYYGPNVTLETSQDTTMSPEATSAIVLQRTNKEPWEPVGL